MRAVKVMTGLAVAAAVGWGGYWVVGSRALDTAIGTALSQTTAFSASDHTILGFPNRFDVTLTEPRLSLTGFSWSAPFVQVFALSYRPNHLLAVFAPDQALSVGGQDLLLHSEDLRASVVAMAALDLPLERATLVGTGMEVSLRGANHRVDTLRAAARRQNDAAYELALVLLNVFPDPEALTAIDPEGLWPRHFTELRLDAEAEFTRPLDRHALEGPAPQIARLTLTGLRAAWPETDVQVTGRLTPGATGQFSGDITLTITGWEALLDRARAAGLLADEDRGLWAPMLDALSAQAVNDRLEVPMAVIDGDVRIGPLLLGTLPALR